MSNLMHRREALLVVAQTLPQSRGSVWQGKQSTMLQTVFLFLSLLAYLVKLGLVLG